MSAQHVLVTGAGGFSGSHLALGLARRGHRVSALVRSDKRRLSQEATGRLEIIAGDLVSDSPLPDRLDAVVHAAATSAWEGVSVEDMERDNVLATRRLIEHAKRAGVQRFIFLSSLSAFGRVDTPLVSETTPARDPDAYGSTKARCEQMLAEAAGVFSSLSIRLPGVVGPQSVRNWLTNVARKARAGETIEIFNPEQPFNNAVHIDDLVDFTAGLLERTWKGADMVTIGSKGQMPIREVVQRLVDAAGGRARIQVKPSGKPGFLVSNVRAVEHYGYRPSDIAEVVRRLSLED